MVVTPSRFVQSTSMAIGVLVVQLDFVFYRMIQLVIVIVSQAFSYGFSQLTKMETALLKEFQFQLMKEFTVFILVF